MRAGVPELLIVLSLVAFRLLPLAALVWALVTLQKIRSTQEKTNRRLEALERKVLRPTVP